MVGEFEQALVDTERDARATQAAANRVATAAKRVVAAAVIGDINALEKAFDEAAQATDTLNMQLKSTRAGWTFDTKRYAEGGSLGAELEAAVAAEGLSMFKQDDRLFCYPSLLRILPSEPAIEIDRKKSRSLRPSFVAAQLKALRTRRQRFRPEQFLEMLFDAYEWARRTQADASRRLDGQGPVVELVSLLDLITVFPATKRDYGRAEFTRDLYLLDRSPVRQTHSGARPELSFSRGVPHRLLQIVGEDGALKVYYGVSFTASPR
jgi:hypothetical protein